MKHLGRFLFGSLLVSASVQAMACYTVYDRSNRVLYQGWRPPVDMSLPISDALASRYPGGHMVFDTTTDCSSLAASRLAPVPGGTPLLTHQQTAEAMGLPYTRLAGGIALVQPRDARLAVSVTVVPADTALAAARASRDPRSATVETYDRTGEATRMMGAGPAPRR